MKQYTRREFFDLVWSRPMTDLAKEFGLSDVALHKTCKRHRIPTPGLGYWAKVAAGKDVGKTSFREISDANLNTIRIYPGPVYSLPPEVKQAHAEAKAQVKKKKDVTATYASSPLHPYVESLRRKLETVQMQKSICAVIQDPKYFAVSIAPTSTGRLISVLNAFVHEAESRGYKFEPGEKCLHMRVEGEVIALTISEKQNKVAHIPTEKERAALDKWEALCELKRKRNEWIPHWDKPYVPAFEYPYNGQLVIEVNKDVYHGDGMRRKFSDTTHQTLEKLFPDILVY